MYIHMHWISKFELAVQKRLFYVPTHVDVAIFVRKYLCVPGANLTTVSYNAGVVKI
jgi:hypothetical protein